MAPCDCLYEFLTSLGWSLKFFQEHGDEPVLVPGIDWNPPLTELLPWIWPSGQAFHHLFKSSFKCLKLNHNVPYKCGWVRMVFDCLYIRAWIMRLSTVGWFSLFSGERGKRFFWVIAQPLEWKSDREHVEGTSECSFLHQPCSALKGTWGTICIVRNRSFQ